VAFVFIATTLVVAISKHSARLSCRALKTRETRTPYSKNKIKTKKKGEKMRTRNKSIPIRVTEKELEAIDEAAKKAKKNRTEYLISAALGKEITVIEDLREMIVQLKKIGNNLNQLTRKANAHEVEVVDLTETNNAMGDIYQAIFALARRGDN
jgi:uncharacterized protein (DUF1778 family)